MKKEEKSFESMILRFRQKINELQTPPNKTLTPEEAELLAEYQRLRSRSANFRLLGESDKADLLESEILRIQDKAIAIREKLAKAPSGQQEIYNTIQNTRDAELHKEALKIQKAGLAEYEKTLKEIEESEKALVELHAALLRNAKQRGDLERRKYNLHLRLREIEKALPADEHKAAFPPKSVDWGHFVPQELEDRVGRAFGHKPYLLRD